MMVIDGSAGEGGGQILRSALALSMVTRRPFRIDRIRAARDAPGVSGAHLATIAAATALCNAEVSGAELGSTSLSFRPRATKPGVHRIHVDAPESVGLVLQTLVFPLLRAGEPSVLTFEGCTHAPSAPTFEFLQKSWAPALGTMGAKIELSLETPGLFPKGGGVMTAKITPSELGRFEREERGSEKSRKATTMVAALPESVAERELRAARDRLGLARDRVYKIALEDERGQGNAFWVELEHQTGISVFASIGERGLRAEQVAERAIGAALAFHESDGAVDERLADQLLLPMAIGKGGVFTTTEPSPHAEGQIELLRKFLDVDITTTTRDERTYTIELRGADV
jgi:RNA 3'-terminal phosphate cyclase (ATP)